MPTPGPPLKELRAFMLELFEPKFFGGGNNGRDAAKLFLGGILFLGNIAAREMTEVRVLLHLPLAGVNRSRASLGLLCKFILCAIEMAGQR